MSALGEFLIRVPGRTMIRWRRATAVASLLLAVVLNLVATSDTTPGPPSPSDLDFQTRCAQPGVVTCVGFDSATDIAGGYASNSGIFSGTTTPSLDTTVKASGNSSLKFTIPANSGGDDAGSYFTNFSPDLSVQFGENSEFYIQWRQRFSPEFINPGAGWKQAIIGTGDQPGGQLYFSCTALEVVTQNSYRRGFAHMYNSCTGSISHGPYNPFEESFGSYDFKLQNARPSPYCLYSQGNANPPTYFPPTGNCFGYSPNEWMTFQVGIKTGPRVGDEFVNSYVQLWIAREGQPSELVFNWGPYNLTAGQPAENQKYGKVWFLPYSGTGVFSLAASTWYDELIVSRAKIPDPSGTPPPPDGPIPAVSIGTNQPVYHAGDRLTVTITTDPGETTDRWYLGVALVTPVNTPTDPFSIYRFNPVVELITLQTALARPFADIAARPLSVVLAESFTILDLITLPADLPVGSYQWLTTLFSEDLSRVSDVAAAPFTFE